MNLIINGINESFDTQRLSLSDLLVIHKVQMPDMVSVELNGAILDRKQFTETLLSNGDQIEFLYFMGGGSQSWGISTKAVHSGSPQKCEGSATALPIYETASFDYESAEDLEAVFSGKKFGYIYSRIGNPTVAALEQRIASLENGIGAAAVSSGLSAIASIVLALADSGDEIISSRSLFGGTLSLFENLVLKNGVKTRYVDIHNEEEIRKAVNEKTRLIFLETIGNPKLDVPDVKKISKIASENRIPLVADSTLTPPDIFQGKDFGVSISVHSSTKYITGNGTAVGGIFSDLGNFDWSQSRTAKILEYHKRFTSFAFLAYAKKEIIQNLGNCLSPFNAFLQCLGLETLALRMDRHCSNALSLAEFLKKNPAVREVNYTGLPGNPYNEIVKNQYGGRGSGVLTFRLSSKKQCFDTIRKFKLVKNLANLGDSKTCLVHPGSTIYSACSLEQKQDAGVTDDLIRVSVGIEDIRDIIADFEQALKGA